MHTAPDHATCKERHFCADTAGWQKLEWRHQQLVRAAASLPDARSLDKADAVFGGGTVTESERAELDSLRTEVKMLAQYASPCRLIYCWGVACRK